MDARVNQPVPHNPEPSTSAADPSDSPGKSNDFARIVDKLTKSIMNHIDKNHVRDIVRDVMNPSANTDEVICINVATVFQRLKEQDKFNIMIHIVDLVYHCREDEVNTVEIYERTIDNILRYLMEKDLINDEFSLAFLVRTADYTLRSNVSKEKWTFISEKWKTIGIKGVRHLFKYLLEFQQKLPPVLSPAQKRQLLPMENLLVEILDLVPPIFTMTELYQFKNSIYLHAFPRVVEKVAQIKAYCRAMADLVFVVGRSYMFPILAHPLFQPLSASWKVDKNVTMLFSRLTYLPNRKELSSPQVYLFHMILKQPRGKETLNNMLKNCARAQAPRTFELIVTMLVNETMAAVENLPANKEIPRYQWDHLLSIVIFMAQFEFQGMSGVIRSLSAVLRKQKYTRARDEIMWLMLQIMGSFGPQISKETCEDMAKLHKLLYPAWMKSDTYATDGDPERGYRFVRHLSTACMYVLQSEMKLPTPSQYLETQIEFIKMKAQEQITDLPLIAILTNAYRTDIGKKSLHQIAAKLEGNTVHEESFLLPYGKAVNPVLQPLEYAFIDSLAMRSKMHLVQLLGSVFSKGTSQRMPSPAYFESYCRLFYTLEHDFGVKLFGATISKAASQSNSNNAAEGFREFMHIILDMMANRLANIPANVHYRQTTCLTLISVLHSTTTHVQGLFARELYSMSEQVLMREFSWMPPTEVIKFCFELLGRNRSETRSVNAHLCNPEIFYQMGTDSKVFHVCPEIVRMLHISLLRTAKIMDKDFSEEPDFLHHIGKVFKWTPVQMKSFPTAFKNVPGVIDEGTDCRMNEDIHALIHTDYMQFRGLAPHLLVDYMSRPERKPTVLCVIYRAFIDGTYGETDPHGYQVEHAFYQILNMMSPKAITAGTNWLSEFVIFGLSENPSQDFMRFAVQVLIKMVFHKYYLPFERLLLALVLHPSNDAKTKLGLSIIFALLQCQECQERLSFYEQKVQNKHQRPKEFFEGNAEYHRAYPEYTYQEFQVATPQHGQLQPQINPKNHPTTYYGSLIERLLPITDAILSRSLEMELPDQEMNVLIRVISPIYKYHPNIFTFVYSVLHTQHEIIGHSSIARIFVTRLIGSRPTATNKSSYLTVECLQYNHQHGSFETVVESLVRRIIECSEFTLEPPDYVEPDWRTAELSAPAQALYLSCIELMASPHDATKAIPAIVSVLCKSDIVYTRPYATLNAVGQLLTALPNAYAKELHDVFAEVIEQHRLNDLRFEDIVYDNFEESVLLRMTNREMTINYALQAYWHHGNQFNVSQFTSFFLDVVYDKITTENELWYFLRLMLPLQQWVFEAKIRQFWSDCITQAKGVMSKLGELCQNGVTLEHGAELCDVFYHLKYQCLGDSLQNEAAELLEKLPQNLRERFKYYMLSKKDEEPAPAVKVSTVVQPDLGRLIKTRSNASERVDQ